MVTNDVLRSLRYLLRMNNAALVDVCRLANCEVTQDQMFDFLRDEEDPKIVPVPARVLAGFLDGLIYHKRGKDESRPIPPPEPYITNNVVLKKLRVAFQLREDDMLELISSTTFAFGKSELSAILRKKGHPNYREAGDQALRNFLRNLTARLHSK